MITSMDRQLFVLLCSFAFLLKNVKGDALDEDFGYVDVRSGAHMFWVTYHTELPGDWKQYPLIMWLQGGPGASGVGYGNFDELGPYDINGNLRPGRWTQKANVMFVDNPVGTGYSYVDSLNLLCTNNTQIANDLVTLVTSVFTDYPDMQEMDFYVFSESYGGKMAIDFALAFNEAIANGKANSNFRGAALGDSWISPIDSVNTWGSFLYSMGFVNQEGREAIDSSAALTQRAVDNENWNLATSMWSTTEGVVFQQTGGINFYNVLAEEDIYDSPQAEDKKTSHMKPEIQRLYNVLVKPEARDDLTDFMNGPQAEAWNIPDNVVWGGQSGDVFSALYSDFMVPVISSVVDALTNTDLLVVVYTGDLDLICDTPGTYAWIENMDYPQKGGFEADQRENLYVPIYSSTAAYLQEYENFCVFTILRSGHMVPIDAPEMCLSMLDLIFKRGNQRKVGQVVKKSKDDPRLLKMQKIVGKNAKSPAKPKDILKEVESRVEDSLGDFSKVQKFTSSELKAKSRIAHSHLSKATPFGRKYDKGNIFNPKMPPFEK